MHPFVLALDLLGTFVFAISGATLGVRKRLDLFGVLVLSLAAAVSGGIARTSAASSSGTRRIFISSLAMRGS